MGLIDFLSWPSELILIPHDLTTQAPHSRSDPRSRARKRCSHSRLQNIQHQLVITSFLFLLALLFTSSKAPVATSVALVTTSCAPLRRPQELGDIVPEPLLVLVLVRHLLKHLQPEGRVDSSAYSCGPTASDWADF